MKPAQSLPWPTSLRGHVWGCRGFPVPTGSTEEPSQSSQKPVMEGLSSVLAERRRNRDPESSESCMCLLCAVMPSLPRVTEDLVCCQKRSLPCSLPHTDCPTCLCAHEGCSSLSLNQSPRLLHSGWIAAPGRSPQSSSLPTVLLPP